MILNKLLLYKKINYYFLLLKIDKHLKRKFLRNVLVYMKYRV